MIEVIVEANAAMNKMFSTRNLSAVGKSSLAGGSIERLIRPRAPLPPSKRKNVPHILKDDKQSVGHDGDRLIARAIKAIIGVVYFDGGYEAAKRVMTQLKLTKS